MTPKYAILVEDVWFRYREGIWALKGVNLAVRPGECLAILGSNGAGKTTLIKHFNGLLKPQRGVVKVFGVDTRKATVAQLSRRVGLVFQNPLHMFFSETVWDEVAFSLRNFGFPEDVVKRRVEGVLKMLDLYEYAERSPFTLSGGEMRRLALACILAYDPDVIVLDEPTVGQDYLQKQRISEIIRMLRLQGKTVIVVTHDVEFVAENFERVVVMCDGMIVADGNARDVLYSEDVVRKARLVEPVVVKLAKRLGATEGLRPLTPYEAKELIMRLVSK